MTPKFFKFYAAVFIWALLFSACTKINGDGPIVKENRTAANFSELELGISGDVVFKQDNNYKIEVEAQQNIQDVLETTVIGNELVIKFKNNVRVKSHHRILVTVSAPNVSSLTVSGSGNLRTSGELQTSNIRMKISGSGNIFIPKLVAANMESVVSGSGDILVSEGTANNETLRISGSGSIDLSNVAAKSATTTTSGSGTMKVHLSETLDASISGSGTVYYKGSPIISTHISGSGKVKPM